MRACSYAPLVILLCFPGRARTGAGRSRGSGSAGSADLLPLPAGSAVGVELGRALACRARSATDPSPGRTALPRSWSRRPRTAARRSSSRTGRRSELEADTADRGRGPSNGAGWFSRCSAPGQPVFRGDPARRPLHRSKPAGPVTTTKTRTAWTADPPVLSPKPKCHSSHVTTAAPRAARTTRRREVRGPALGALRRTSRRSACPLRAAVSRGCGFRAEAGHGVTRPRRPSAAGPR